jgi:hypothetical protein
VPPILFKFSGAKANSLVILDVYGGAQLNKPTLSLHEMRKDKHASLFCRTIGNGKKVLWHRHLDRLAYNYFLSLKKKKL